MTVGLPASGKSTWAKFMVSEHKSKYKRVNKDDLRAMLDCTHHTEGNEKFVLAIRDQIIDLALSTGKDVIVDDTNIHPKHIEHIKKKFGDRAEIEIKSFMDVPVEECVERDAKRTGTAHVGKRVIYSMHKQYKQQNCKDYSEYPVWHDDRKLLLICDIDGTLNILKDRSPYDIEKSLGDGLNKHTKHVLETYSTHAVEIALVTGRSDKFKKVTVDWLTTHNVPYKSLYMRVDGDERPDDVVKKEIFEAHFKDQFNILFVLEDRDRVVSMYRDELNLPVFQVKYGNY